MAILEQLKKPNGPYDFKGVGSPEYYLGGDVKIAYLGDSIEELSLSAKTYLTCICNKVELLMGWELKGFNNPMDPHYHVEIDESDFVVGEDISKYRVMVGSLNWLITSGRYNTHFTTTTLARHMMMPRQGKIHAMRHVEQYNWFPLHSNVQEKIPFGMPEPKDKTVVTSRSTTCVLMFLNKTLISTCGSEIVAGRIAVDMAVELSHILRMLGAPVKGTTYLFGDNQSMHQSANNYHQVRETVAAGVTS
eukprot:8169001-Ditylum_brightwellii.AAC.1